MNKNIVLALAVAAMIPACTARSVYVQPTPVQQRYLITMGDTERPYISLGYLQMTRKGADIFGFISVVDADLNKMFGDELIRELERRGADGIVHVQFSERQWTTSQRILFALPPMFLFPLATQVEIRGELVRFVDPGPPGASQAASDSHGAKVPRS